MTILFLTDFTSTIRNNGFKIIGKRFRSNVAEHFFFNRIVNIWKFLPAQTFNSKRIEMFKKNSICTSSPNRVFHSCVKTLHNVFSSFVVVVTVDYVNFLTFLYKFHINFSIVHSIASSSSQLRLGGVGGNTVSAFLHTSFLSEVIKYTVKEARLLQNITIYYRKSNALLTN